jgi:hypothetical protein
MYSYDTPGMVRAPSEFTQHDEEARVAKGRPLTHIITMLVLVGAEACAMDPPRHSLCLGGRGRDLDPELKGHGCGRPASASKDQRGVTQTPADHGETMPPPTGKAEITPTRQRNRRLKEVIPAETGRPETAAEFAKRVAGRFVLKGPKEQKEGGETGQNPVIHPGTPSPEGKEPQLAMQDNYPAEAELIAGLRNQYHKDPFFK